MVCKLNGRLSGVGAVQSAGTHNFSKDYRSSTIFCSQIPVSYGRNSLFWAWRDEGDFFAATAMDRRNRGYFGLLDGHRDEYD